MLVYATVPFCLILATQVGAKRTNRPGISTTDRGFPRARFRSRGGSFSSRARYYSGYTPPRGRGRAFRWADPETHHFWHHGRTLHLHALHLTRCLFWKEIAGQMRPFSNDQLELASVRIDLHNGSYMACFGLQIKLTLSYPCILAHKQ